MGPLPVNGSPIRGVRAVVIDHDGGRMTVRCIERLVEAGAEPASLQVVLIDNGSRVPVTDEVHRRFPEVEIRRSDVNLGFGGACNLAFRDLSGVDAVALVNNDVEVRPGWLKPLMSALGDDRSLGAVSPKMLFIDPFVDLELEVSARRRRRGDSRALGVRLVEVEVLGERRSCRPQLVKGFHGPEPGGSAEPWFEWTGARALVRVPISGTGPWGARLRLGADERTVVSVRSGGRSSSFIAESGVRWYDVELDGVPRDVVNNAGVVLNADWYGADRGWLDPDDGRWDEPTDIQAWSGGAVLLRTELITQTRGFASELFLYYEDVELSLRAAAAGWAYRYEPASVVRHAHAATTGAGSPLTNHLNERNRLLVVARHAPLGRLPRLLARYLSATASYFLRDGVIPLLNGRRSRPVLAWRRLRALGGFLLMAPSALRRRRRRTS